MPRNARKPKPLDEPAHTITGVAELLTVSRTHVERLIASGELEALDISAPDSRRPTYRVTDRSLRAFMSRRAALELQ